MHTSVSLWDYSNQLQIFLKGSQKTQTYKPVPTLERKPSAFQPVWVEQVSHVLLMYGMSSGKLALWGPKSQKQSNASAGTQTQDARKVKAKRGWDLQLQNQRKFSTTLNKPNYSRK